MMGNPSQGRGAWKQWFVLAGFVVIGGYLMTTEHRVHLLSVFPLLILLACPLMMLFMHHDDAPPGGLVK